MKNTRIAAQLRSLSLKPSLENDEQSTTETGPDGEGVVKQKLDENAASPNQTTEETAPAENKDLTTKTTEVGERSDLETAETTADKDGENVVVSTEGIGGAMKAFGKTWSIGLRNMFKSNTGMAKAYAKFDVQQKREAEKLKQQIEQATARINAYREGDIEKAKAEGIRLGPVKDLDDDQMLDAILRGQVIPFYTTYYGHKVEKLEKELEEKLERLSYLYRVNGGVSMESEGEEGEGSEIETGPGSEGVVKATVDTDAETPNQTTEETTPGENEDVTAKTVDVGTRSDLESAQTEIKPGEGEPVVSNEGFKGAFNAAGKVWGAYFGSLFEGEGIIKSNKRMSQIDIDQKRQAEKLKQRIEALAARIAAYHEGDIEKAKAEGVSTGSTKALSEDDVIDAVVKGRSIPFYTTYYGHKVEQLEGEFQAKLKELDGLIKGGKVSMESIEGFELTVSQEGFLGGVKGFLLGGLGGGIYGGYAAGKAEKLKKQIEHLSKEVNVLRVRGAKSALEEGKITPKDFQKEISFETGDIIKGALLGWLFSGIYGAIKGSELQNKQNELKAKLAELKVELEKNDKGSVSTESLDEAAEAAQAFADGAAGAAAAAAAASEGEGTDAVAVVEDAAAVVEEVTDAVDPDAEEDAAIEAGRAELDGLDAEIADGEAHVEEYEQAEATLESLIDALQDAQASGGLTRQAARFATITFESIGVRLTGRPFVNAQGDALMPSLESFGGSMRRDEATTVSLEGAKEVLQQVWEVLKKTFATIKDWIVKFVKAVFDQGERYNQRADKVLAAAAKVGSAPKAQTVSFSGASKVAIGSEVSLAGLDVLVKIATEAGVRSSDASRAIIAARQGLNTAMQAGSDIEKVREQLLNIGREAGANAAAGAFRSEVFSKDAEVEGKKGYSTDVLPGNITLVNVDPLEEGNVFAALFYMAKGGRVTVVADPNAGEVKSEQKTLSAEEIKTVANKVKAVVAAAAKSKSELKDEALDFANINVPENTPDEVANLFKTNAKALGKLLHTSTGSIAKLLKYSVGTSGYYLDYANASLKQYGAAVEGEATKPEAGEAAAA